jgi:anti-sigma-K factor RskA
VTARDELHASSGAYALDALSGAERAEFERELTISEHLRAEVTELMDTAVELALSVAPVEPPASLRASVLAAIESEPQHPARVEERREATPAALKARARWSPLLRVGAVAASVALVVGLGFTIRAGIQAQNDMATASQINEIQAAEDYQRASVRIDGGGTATLVWSHRMKRSALIVAGLRDLPAGSTYELWYIDGDGVATPAGMFDMDGDGDHSVVLSGDMDAGDTVGVTVEPAGGSDAPTTDPVIVVPTA